MRKLPLSALALSMTMATAVACDMGDGDTDAGNEPDVVVEPAADGGVEPEDDAGTPEPTDAGAEPDPEPSTIYERLGETAGIETAIGGFIGRVVGDPAINAYFLNDNLDATRLTACLVHQVAVATGGPGDAYPSGVGSTLEVDDLNGGTVVCRSMEDVHVGLGISAQDNADLTGHLVDELTALGVAADDIGTIGGVLGALTGIVESPNNNETLYHRLGRKPGITAVVGNFIGRVVADPSINAYFMNSGLDAARLTTCLVRQVGQTGVSGGPYNYAGANDFETDLDVDGNGTIEAAEQCQDMVAIHTGMNISKEEHYALVDHFIAAAVDENDNNADVTLGAGDGAAVQGVLDGLVDSVTEEAAACATGRADVDDDCNVTTLYHRLGGTPAIGAVVGNAFGRILGDATTNGYFLNANYNQAKVDRTAGCLVRQFCSASGGPCVYDGANAFDAAIDTDGNGTVEAGEQCRDMLSTHAGLNIAQYEQDAFKDHVVAAVGELAPGLAAGDVGALGGVLNSTDADVVEATDFTAPGAIYHRIGGKASVMAFLDGVDGGEQGFLSRVTNNTEINGFFGAANVPRLRSCLARQLCEAMGGPCDYLVAGPLVALTDTDDGIADVNGTPDDLTDDTITNCLTMAASHPTTMVDDNSLRIAEEDYDSMIYGDAATTLDALGITGDDINIIADALHPVCDEIVSDGPCTPGTP